MKNNLFAALGVCTLMLLSTLMFAQATQSTAPANSATPARRVMTDQEMDVLRADIRDQRKKLTAANMALTADQAAKFWPIYDQYIDETIKVNDERWSLIQELCHEL